MTNQQFVESFDRESRELSVSPAAFQWYQEASAQEIEKHLLPKAGPGEIKLVVRADWQ